MNGSPNSGLIPQKLEAFHQKVVFPTAKLEPRKILWIFPKFGERFAEFCEPFTEFGVYTPKIRGNSSKLLLPQLNGCSF